MRTSPLLKRKTITFFLLIPFLLLNACQDDLPEKQSLNDRIIIRNDAEQLSRRIQLTSGEEQLSLNEVNLPAGNQSSSGLTEDPTDYTLVLRAEVEPLSVSDSRVQASHVYIDDQLAFVSYNTKGPEYRGGFEVFDISDIKNPRLIHQVQVEGTDYSSIYYEDGKVYLAGATGQAEQLNLNSSALLEIFDYPYEKQLNSRIIDIRSFTATDVKVQGDNIYVTSGSHGGLSKIDKLTLEEVSFVGLDDARSIAFNSDNYVVMQGSPARIKRYNRADDSYIQGFNIGGANIPESKSILTLTDEMAFVPCGREGLRIVSLADGQLMSSISLPEMEGVDDELIVTNAVSVNGESVFTANGAAGIFLSEEVEDEMMLIGSVNFRASANYVASQDHVMFVATGTGGLKIIEIVPYNPEEGDFVTIGDWDDSGIPDYLCGQDLPIPSAITEMANNSFKDRRSLREHRPDFFTPGSATELVLLEDTDLEVIFLNEGAGWTNSFGYYTYDPLNPPQTPGELRSKTILFPNVSKGRNSGLVRGDKICLTRLKAGTVVGFFLNARGWKKKQLTKGMFTNYSNPLLNTHWNKGEQQASVLLDAGHDHYLLLSFEDHRPPRSDMDFEDASFLLLPSNPNSIDYSQLADLE